MKETGTWLTRGFTVSALITIVVLLMGQSKSQGVVETKIETNEKAVIEIKEEHKEHEDTWQTFLISQTALNKSLTEFVDEQKTINKTQAELNEEFKEHLIKDED